MGILFPFLALSLIVALCATPATAEARRSNSLISAPDGTLFLLYGDARHASDPATLAALGIDEQNTRVVSQRTLEALPLGLPLPTLRNGDLVAGPDARPYLLLHGLHAIPEEETFHADGWGGYRAFAATPVALLDDDLFGVLPRRAPLADARRTGPGLFEWGNCTWWVAQRRAVTWLGNGGEWYANALAQGYAVGDRPLPGAILVRGSAGGGLGHVAYVETVDSTSFTVSEMNVQGLGVLGARTYDLVGNPPPGLIGFIYWRFGEEPSATAIEDDARGGGSQLGPNVIP